MTIGDTWKLHREAWNRLFDVVELRNKLLRRLAILATRAMDMTPATGMVIEVDTGLARQLLDEINTLTPRIFAGVAEVNLYAEQIGKPIIH